MDQSRAQVISLPRPPTLPRPSSTSAHAGAWCGHGLRSDRRQAQRLGMMTFTELASVPSDPLVPLTDQLRLTAAAYRVSADVQFGLMTIGASAHQCGPPAASAKREAGGPPPIRT